MSLGLSLAGYHLGTDYGTFAVQANIYTVGSRINLVGSVQKWVTSALLPRAPGTASHICPMLPLFQRKDHWKSQKSIFSGRFRCRWSLYDLSYLRGIPRTVLAASEGPCWEVEHWDQEELIQKCANATGAHALLSKSHLQVMQGA